MNSVEAEPSDALAWALANAVEQGDWAQAESLQVAILAVKGGGKGGFRKGLGKGKPGPGAAAKGGGGVIAVGSSPVACGTPPDTSASPVTWCGCIRMAEDSTNTPDAPQ